MHNTVQCSCDFENAPVRKGPIDTVPGKILNVALPKPRAIQLHEHANQRRKSDMLFESNLKNPALVLLLIQVDKQLYSVSLFHGMST
jgi:hypothetical protein